MNIYFVENTTVGGYDTFSDMVVIAEDVRQARMTHPYHHDFPDRYGDVWDGSASDVWGSSKDVKVTKIGVAGANENKRRVVCSSFHAG